MENRMKIEVSSNIENVSLARTAVACFVSQKDVLMDELLDIKTAVSEAVTNSIMHGYEKYSGTVTVECSYINDDLVIEITDSGKGIENIDEAMQMLYTSKPEEEFAGMGFTIMENFMDEVIVASEVNCGTRVRLTKKLKVISPLKRTSNF